MPTITVQISNIKRVKNNISFIATTGSKVIERTLDFSTVDSWQEFAEWLINQEPDYTLLKGKEKSLSITFHNEAFVDPDTKNESTLRIVDNVDVT